MEEAIQNLGMQGLKSTAIGRAYLDTCFHHGIVASHTPHPHFYGRRHGKDPRLAYAAASRAMVDDLKTAQRAI